mmetsp:Transcript_75508/g.149275  ORF Transcript_75508/g.149275 Transcript_75508/m.149275 type:complete len:206 (-) Transcript_75508:39-656(-)
MSKMSPAGNHEDRLRRLREQIEDFCGRHRLDDRASRIMANMHPADIRKVVATPFPTDCRNPTAFVVSVIRKVEQEAGRAQGYRWDGRSWSEPKLRGRDSRSRSPCGFAASRGRRGSPRRTDGSCRHSDSSREGSHSRSCSVRASHRRRRGHHSSRHDRSRRQQGRSHVKKHKTKKERRNKKGHRRREGGGRRRRDCSDSSYDDSC